MVSSRYLLLKKGSPPKRSFGRELKILEGYNGIVCEIFYPKVLHRHQSIVKVKIFTYQKGDVYIFTAKHWLREVAQLQIHNMSSLYKNGNIFMVTKVNVRLGWEHVAVKILEQMRKIIGEGNVRAKLRADNYSACRLLRELGFVEVDELICFRLDLTCFHQLPIKPQYPISPLSGLDIAAFTDIHNQLFSETLTAEGALRLLSGNFQATSFCIQKDTKVISYVLAKILGRRLYIEEVGTIDKFRRRGFAKRLLRYTLAKAASLALVDAYGYVNSKNYLGIMLFSRLGFEPEHVVVHFQLPLSKDENLLRRGDLF